MSDRTTSSREALSALADGEASAAEVAQVCAAWRGDGDARATWHDYHLIGDVMRSQEAAGVSSGAAFLQQFRERLAQEPVVLAPASSAAAEARRAAAAQVPAKALQPLRRRTWAGPIAVAASFLALVASFLGNPNAPMGGGSGLSSGQLIGAAPASGGLGLSLADAQVSLADGPSFNRPPSATASLVRDPRLDQALAGMRTAAPSSADVSFSNAGALSRTVSFDQR